MSKYNPYTHIVGKVYDLTQENMNDMLNEIDRLNDRIEELHTDSLEDHYEYKRVTTQLIKDLRDENARLQEQLRLTQIDNNLLMTENASYWEALEKISRPTSMWDGFNAKMYWDIAREALKGE